MSKHLKLLGFIVLCELVGIVGSYFTINQIPTWYTTLNKPIFSPPNYLFGPVWTILYALMGASIYRIYQLKKNEQREKAKNIFWIQLFFNFIWTPIFFGGRNILGGLIVITILLVLIAKTIVQFKKLDKLAAILLYPYILWVGFATLLNLSLFILNR